MVNSKKNLNCSDKFFFVKIFHYLCVVKKGSIQEHYFCVLIKIRLLFKTTIKYLR